MVTEKKYLDIDGLNVYTELIKGKIGDMQTTIDNIALDDDLKAVFGDDWNSDSNSGSNLNYLSFTAVEDSTIKLVTGNINTFEIIEETPAVNLEYSMNGIDFQPWNYETQLSTGQTLYLRGDNPNGFSSNLIVYSFGASTGKFECHGNVMSLLYKDDFEGKLTIPCECCFANLFAILANNPEAYSLLTAPELPATTLTGGCYGRMFLGCTSLTTAPELPATELKAACYFGMFYGCTSLTTAPELPATTLAEYCYNEMFAGCTSLTTAPEPPATTLAEYCYRNMFKGCTSLTTAPELPATTLAEGCYVGMFDSCTSLTSAPELPAITLAEGCYGFMFEDCTSLTTAPELPATTLAEYCYEGMFAGCTELNYIKMLATDISAEYCLDNWVSDVAGTGTFIKHPNMTSLPTGLSGIPTGWTVRDADNGGSTPGSKYLAFTAEEDNSTISLSSGTDPDIKYSLNDGEWTQWDYSAITLNTGDTVRMKGNNSNGFNTDGSNQFQMTGKIGASGNIMSLLYEDDFEGKLTIPCGGCYVGMFDSCTSLTSAPELPAITLAEGCYASMFAGCESLTSAPELPATTLAEGCYAGMFDSCTSLTTAPELPAITLAEGCYIGMFADCTKLNYIKMLATDINAEYCLDNWVRGVASTGTFVKSLDVDIPYGTYGIPDGWVVEFILPNNIIMNGWNELYPNVEEFNLVNNTDVDIVFNYYDSADNSYININLNAYSKTNIMPDDYTRCFTQSQFVCDVLLSGEDYVSGERKNIVIIDSIYRNNYYDIYDFINDITYKYCINEILSRDSISIVIKKATNDSILPLPNGWNDLYEDIKPFTIVNKTGGRCMFNDDSGESVFEININEACNIEDFDSNNLKPWNGLRIDILLSNNTENMVLLNPGWGSHETFIDLCERINADYNNLLSNFNNLSIVIYEVIYPQ